jgi:tetratricopeptide (TPR) repeat protein
MQAAKTETENLKTLYNRLTTEKDKGKEAAQVAVQIKTAEAWMEFKQGRNEKALALMTAAVAMEDSMEKHPVTPGEVIPAGEALGEMLLEMGRFGVALEAFEQTLKSHPGRLNALYGAGVAASKIDNKQKANSYFKKLLENVGTTNSGRMEVRKVKQFMSGVTAAL